MSVRRSLSNKINPIRCERLLNWLYVKSGKDQFLIEKSGVWEEEAANLFRNIPMQYDFYLDYEITDPRYSKTWRLYYPAYLDDE